MDIITFVDVFTRTQSDSITAQAVIVFLFLAIIIPAKGDDLKRCIRQLAVSCVATEDDIYTQISQFVERISSCPRAGRVSYRLPQSKQDAFVKEEKR